MQRAGVMGYPTLCKCTKQPSHNYRSNATLFSTLNMPMISQLDSCPLKFRYNDKKLTSPQCCRKYTFHHTCRRRQTFLRDRSWRPWSVYSDRAPRSKVQPFYQECSTVAACHPESHSGNTCHPEIKECRIILLLAIRKLGAPCIHWIRVCCTMATVEMRWTAAPLFFAIFWAILCHRAHRPYGEPNFYLGFITEGSGSP